MMVRVFAVVLLIAMAFLGGMAWMKSSTHEPPPVVPPTNEPQMPGSGSGAPAAEAPTDPGLAWTKPAHWTQQPDRPMRFMTYAIPATGGDTEAGECAVFYFGPHQGGTVDANISRWADQIENPGKAERSEKDTHGMKVHYVHVEGTYLAPAGPMMQSQGKKPSYTLLGAIVDGPQGAVFFKFTGPTKTVSASKKDFDALIASIHKP
jgi:hypothetical protein